MTKKYGETASLTLFKSKIHPPALLKLTNQRGAFCLFNPHKNQSAKTTRLSFM